MCSRCRRLHSVSISAITDPQPNIGIVEWGLYWSSLLCSYHRTFNKLAPDKLMKCLLLISLVKMSAELPKPLVYVYVLYQNMTMSRWKYHESDQTARVLGKVFRSCTPIMYLIISNYQSLVQIQPLIGLPMYPDECPKQRQITQIASFDMENHVEIVQRSNINRSSSDLLLWHCEKA